MIQFVVVFQLGPQVGVSRTTEELARAQSSGTAEEVEELQAAKLNGRKLLLLWVTQAAAAGEGKAKQQNATKRTQFIGI